MPLPQGKQQLRYAKMAQRQVTDRQTVTEEYQAATHRTGENDVPSWADGIKHNGRRLTVWYHTVTPFFPPLFFVFAQRLNSSHASPKRIFRTVPDSRFVCVQALKSITYIHAVF